MAAKANLTKSANIDVRAREIDFVTRFGDNWQALRDLLGIMRPIKKQMGAVLKSKEAKVTLQDSVGEGEEIPYSLATFNEKTYEEMTLEKYKKAVSAEAIQDHGYDIAITMSDNAFLKQLQGNVLTRFYNFLKTGTLTGTKDTFQQALATAKGLVENKWGSLNLDITEVVAFVNVMDYYTYLGDANITVQNYEGIQYLKDFMGYRTVFLLDDNKIPQGKVLATPVENIVLYYLDASDSDFARAGLEFTTDGVTNLIGFHTEGNYQTLVSECTAIMGMTLFAEYLNGIANVSFGGASVASEAKSTSTK
ncbi:MAG: hypothetical protein HFE51_04980 [Clostridia bacterium]|nr:hypothetical protein [Clostridia bacterium]